MMAGDFTWHRTTAVPAGASSPVPLVFIAAWMQAAPKHVAVYAALFSKSMACDVVVVHPQVLNLWLPLKAWAVAKRLLDVLASELRRTGARPVLAALFSGSAKACHWQLIHLLRQDATYAAVRQCLVGEMYDSSPIDFVSRAGIMYLSPPDAPLLQRAGVSLLASGLDYFCGSIFERHRCDFFATITASLSSNCPVLILHSEDDSIAPSAFIASFADELKRNGRRNVRRICWLKSEHVAHLRQHQQEYTDAVRRWVTDCIRAWQDLQGVATPQLVSNL